MYLFQADYQQHYFATGNQFSIVMYRSARSNFANPNLNFSECSKISKKYVFFKILEHYDGTLVMDRVPKIGFSGTPELAEN